jgi:tungstate transport system substrate-binding protein
LNPRPPSADRSQRLLATAAVTAGALALTCSGGERPLRLGTTYTVEQSGALALLDSLMPPVPVNVVIGPSGQMLTTAAHGDLDLVLVHAPPLEERILVAAGYARLRCPFVTSGFAILGPRDDPAGTARAGGAVNAFRRIAEHAAPFISRADSSGTHVKELELWRTAGVSPSGQLWYVESGADQVTALRIAEQRRAYALADLPTVATLADLDLAVLVARDKALQNPYTLYVLRAAPPHAGDAFSAWALGPWRARLVTRRLPDGSPAFEPAADGCSSPTAG